VSEWPDMAVRGSSLIGARLGQYEIKSVLGSGGMGDVYRADDTKLGRPVAIKLLAEDLVSASARQRFQREAQLASSLNHPHILTVYDVGEFDGRQYLVTEFVDGGTLQEWAFASPRTWRNSVDLMVGVADALATAHAAGILHRDIKPSNILVTTSGYAKLADFGLAKLQEPRDSPEATRTMGAEPTKAGIVLGTLAYMSPEQASGQAADARSDIFSFGIVLYELLARRRPFSGDSDLELLERIKHASPEPLPADIPLALRLVVEKSLEHDPADRYQSMREVVIDLRRLARGKSGEIVPVTASTPSRRVRTWSLGAAGVLLALIAGAVIGRWWSARAAEPFPRGIQLQRITEFVGTEEHPAISPDGKTVAFVAAAEGRRHIWVRLLAGGPPLQITHDVADHAHPRWTPDSSSLMYFRGSTKEGESEGLWEIPALGGTSRQLAASMGEGDISHDGRRIVTFQSHGGRTVLAILQRDGSPVQVKPLPALAEVGTPRWSPDDRSVAFVGALEIAFNRALYVVEIDGTDPIMLATAPRIQGLAWLPDGSGLVYASSAGSTAVYPPTYNLRSVSARRGGEATDRQLTFGDVSYVEPDVVASGRLVASRVRMQSDVWRFPVDGLPAENVKNAVPVTRQTGQVQTPSASPDGMRVVYLSDSGGHVNVWVAHLDGSAARQITFENDPAIGIGIPIWSPTGDRIVFVRSQGGVTSEWLVNPDGSGLREFVPRGAGAAWSRDGRWLYYMTPSADGTAATCIEKVLVDGGAPVRVRCDAANMVLTSDGSAMFYMPAVGTPGVIRKAEPEGGESRPFVTIAPNRIPFVPQGYVLSPDDRWLAMPLKDANTTNIWAFSTMDGSPRQLTDFGQRATLIARQVSWSADGKYIYAALVESDADVVVLDGLLR